MRSIYRVLLVFLLVISHFWANAATYTATTSGNWTSVFPNPNSLNNDDVLVIGAGVTVTVSSSIEITALIRIRILGVLQFADNGRLFLRNTSSVIAIFDGASIIRASSANGNDERLVIGSGNGVGDAEWSGNDNPVLGPAAIINDSILSGSAAFAILPVNLTQFTLQQQQQQVLLRWTTAAEKNNSHFEVQRSFDTRNWQTIGTVKGKGTTDATSSYQYVDAAPMNGVNYYRLKQVDFDVTTAFYSAQIQTKVAKAGNQIRPFPNPMQSYLALEAPAGVTQFRSVRLYNEVGQEVAVYFQVNPLQQLATGHLLPGKYIIKAVSASGVVLPAVWVIKN